MAVVALVIAAGCASVSPDSAIYAPVVHEIASRNSARTLLLAEVRLANQPANVRTVSARSVRRRVPRGASGVIHLGPPVVEGDRAEVEVSFVCGPVCGYGDRYILARRGEGWVVVETINLWIA